ncbi:MAG: hypothetical protein AB1742_14735 [bacterium]
MNVKPEPHRTKNRFHAFQCLLSAFFCVVMVVFSRTYWPTRGFDEIVHRTVFTFFIVLFLLEAAFPRPFERARRFHRALRLAALLPAAAPLAYILFWTHVISMGVLMIWSLKLGVALIVIEALTALYVLRLLKVGAFPARWLRLAITTALFVNSFLAVPLYANMWRPPSREECDRHVVPGVVERLTPHGLPAGLSYPYDVVYIPEKKVAAASFKMAGNLVLGFWNRLDANRFVAVDVSGARPPRLFELPLEGGMMAEVMEWNTAGEILYLTRVGYDSQAITAIDFKRYPELKIIRTRKIAFEPNGAALDPGGRTITVIGIEGRVAGLDALDLSDASPASRKRVFKRNVMNVSSRPGSALIYASLLGRMVMEYDAATGKTRAAKVPFGGGDLVMEPANGLLYQTDVLFDSLNVVDTADMTLRARVPLGYTPRAVRVDPGRDLLMVGDWFGGGVNIYRLSTMKRLRPPVPVGRYIRDFAYDEERGRLFCACICGLYQLDVPALLSRTPDGGTR